MEVLVGGSERWLNKYLMDYCEVLTKINVISCTLITQLTPVTLSSMLSFSPFSIHTDSINYKLYLIMHTDVITLTS